MESKRLKDFPAKTTPVSNDIVYIGNSENLDTESKCTISQISDAIFSEPLSPEKGGTGTDNGEFLLSLEGNFSTWGPSAEVPANLIFRLSADSNVILPPGNSSLVSNGMSGVQFNDLQLRSSTAPLVFSTSGSENATVINYVSTAGTGPRNCIIPDIGEDGTFAIVKNSNEQLTQKSFGADSNDASITIDGVVKNAKFISLSQDEYSTWFSESYSSDPSENLTSLNLFRARGTKESPEPGSDGDSIGSISFSTFCIGDIYSSGANISAKLEGTAIGTSAPMNLILNAFDNVGNSSSAEFHSNGNINFINQGDDSDFQYNGVTLVFKNTVNTTFSGIYSSPIDSSFSFMRQGQKITLSLPEIISLASTSDFISSTINLPHEIRPSSDRVFLIYGWDNGDGRTCRLNIKADGTITIFATLDNDNFSGTGQSGFFATDITYIM